MDEQFTPQPDGRLVSGPSIGDGPGGSRLGARLLVIGIVTTLAILAVSVFFINRGEGESIPRQGVDRAGVTPPPSPSPSFGITQSQLDRLGDSIQARYRSGDTEVAQALLDNFMKAHPECVSAVMAGGEGRMRDVLAESEEVAAYLKSTGPRANTYTTVITNRVDGVIKGAVLGVSCEEEA